MGNTGHTGDSGNSGGTGHTGTGRAESRGARGRRRGVYLIPNLLTTCNIIAGFYCLVAAFHGRFEQAGFAIVAAGIFDILDGRVARAVGGSSRFGVEYDSLADLVSFGLAPAFLMYSWTLEAYGRIGWAAACLYVICVALRLARHNVNQEDLSHKATLFTGMPSPGSAGMICTLVLFEDYYGVLGSAAAPISLVLVFGLAFLTVSTMPYGRGATAEPHPFLNLVSGVLVLVAVVVEPHLVLFIIGVSYLSSGFVRLAVTRLRARRKTAKTIPPTNSSGNPSSNPTTDPASTAASGPLAGPRQGH